MSKNERQGALVWFRRDLRLDDHRPLAAAIQAGGPVYGCFVFDPDILDPLERADRRVAFIRDSLAELNVAWQQSARETGRSEKDLSGIRLIFLHGRPVDVIPDLAVQLRVAAVFAGRDVEPSAKHRDAEVDAGLIRDGRRLILVKDQVVFSSDEVLTGDGRPYSVFTPYKNAWRKRLQPSDIAPSPTELDSVQFGVVPKAVMALSLESDGGPSLSGLGFQPLNWAEAVVRPGMSGAGAALTGFMPQLDRYDRQRDFPSLGGTSRLSVHLRFGTISVRTLVRMAYEQEMLTGSTGARCWLDELIWREFYQAVLDHCPWVTDACWRRMYDAIRWDDAPALFAAWCEGRTGYPFVDAAMRELVSTGFMHNRARMVVASFLTKDLGIDWRRGERFFARHLLDYDLAANNGGWQWAASTGCDAQPYFRIFNPVTQSQKFDPTGEYIRRWVPELDGVPLRYLHAPWSGPQAQERLPGLGSDYPAPIVDHSEARERTLARYGVVRDQR